MSADVIPFPELLKLDYAEIPGECEIIVFPKSGKPYRDMKRRLHEKPIFMPPIEHFLSPTPDMPIVVREGMWKTLEGTVDVFVTPGRETRPKP